MKKENYFPSQNKKQIINKMEKELSSYYSKKRTFAINKENIALLVIDMQKFFLDPYSHAFIPSSLSIIEPINNLIFHFKNKNLLVIFTRNHAPQENEKNYIIKKWWGDSLLQSNPLFELEQELNSTNSLIINKYTYDAFYETKLEDTLKNRNIQQLVITGVHTHLCCETTARVAFCKGYLVWLPIDSLATYNKELHMGSLRSACHGFGIPTTSEKIIEELKSE